MTAGPEPPEPPSVFTSNPPSSMPVLVVAVALAVVPLLAVAAPPPLPPLPPAEVPLPLFELAAQPTAAASPAAAMKAKSRSFIPPILAHRWLRDRNGPRFPGAHDGLGAVRPATWPGLRVRRLVARGWMFPAGRL